VRTTLRERGRYLFDNAMSRGTPALIGLLALGTGVLIAIVTGLVMVFTPGEVRGADDALWMNLMRALDPGTVSGDQGTAPFLALMLATSLGGIFLVSALVGVLASGLDNRLTQLRKGRSRVVEKGHTIVLGWSDQLFTILSELAEAADGERRNEKVCVVILAERDKVEMEDAVRARVDDRGHLRVVCRTGNPSSLLDLEIARPDTASVVIVPTPDAPDPDIKVIKALLALEHRAWPAGRPAIVAGIADSTNLPAAMLAGPSVTFVDAEDVTARLIVQSRRHPGLSAVCTDLLGFAGDEIHTKPEPELVGRAYGEVLGAYATATVFGLRTREGEVLVNPPSDRMIADGDELLVLAASLRAVRRATTTAPIVPEALSVRPRAAEVGESTLVLGWNDRAPTIVRLLDQYLPTGSTLTVAAPQLDTVDSAAFAGLESMKVTTVGCDPTRRSALESLSPGDFQHVIVLADDEMGGEPADARTLVQLLHLRDVKNRNGYGYAIVGEITDDANRGLAQVTRADDFVVSTKMISLLLAQLSRNPKLSDVFHELFDPRGSDIYLKPAADYLVPGVTGNFATVIEAARLRGETAIGYRRDVDVYAPPAYGVVLNPDKAAPLALDPADRVIVLAEH
jgi:voltage-gated potassium channel Kch